MKLQEVFVLLQYAITQSSATIPQSTYCTGKCAEEYAIGYKYDSSNWVSFNVTTDPFYQIPENCTTSTPGDIIKWQDVPRPDFHTKWTIPGGMTLSRFLYWSEGVDGSPVPASAFALLPYGLAANQTKLRTIVWAHGTSGYVGQCAPTNHRNLYYDWSAPYTYAQAGYAVIGPDYAGMGTDIPGGFNYLAGIPHAADVAFSLIAARKQIGGFLTDEYVVVGQSEGGMVAWRTNERLAQPDQQSLLAAGQFLGSVALAPANRAMDFLVKPGYTDSGRWTVGVYLLESLAKLYPDEIRLEDWLTPEGLGLLPLLDGSCVYGAGYLGYTVPFHDVFYNNSWTKTRAAEEWRIKYNGQGYKQLAGPLLVVQGTLDHLVPPPFTIEDFNATCTQNSKVQAELFLYFNGNHDVPTTAGQPNYLAWVKDRFDGVVLPDGCQTHEVRPLLPHLWNNFATTYIAHD